MEKSRDLVCPDCRSRITLNDVNVAADLALCRSCGKRHSFLMLDGAAQIPSVDALSAPPKGVKVDSDLHNRKTITYRRLAPVLLFLIPFTAVWSGFSMWGLYIRPLMQGRIEWSTFLFGIPFLLGTIVLVSVILLCLFGRWVIRLADGMGMVFVGIGPVGWRRYFEYDRNTVVSLKLSTIKQNDQPMKGICIRTAGSELLFGTTIHEKSKEYIASVLREHILQS